MQHELTKLSDDGLITAARKLADHERETTLKVLHHLREIEWRRLFAARGFSSLYEFAVVALKYSDGAAHRRISAMRLLRDLPAQEAPKVERAIEEGKLTVSTLSTLQGFFQHQRKEQKAYTPEKKLELVTAVESKSKRDTEKMLAAIAPEAVRRDHVRIIDEQKTEVRFTADDELMKKLQKIRDLGAHRLKGQDYNELLHMMADLALKGLENSRTITSRASGKRGVGRAVGLAMDGRHSPTVMDDGALETPLFRRTTCDGHEANALQDSTSPERSKFPSTYSRYIRKPLKNQVWQKAQGQCTYIDPKSKRRCTSTHALQIDHITPFALGGSSTAGENLRLLCRAHNQQQALNIFGRETMQHYLQNSS